MRSDMPHRPTIDRAMRVTNSRSCSAPRGNYVEYLLLGSHAAQGADNAAAQVGLFVAVAILFGGRNCNAQCTTSRNDRDLANRIRPRLQHTEQGMAGFVISGSPPVLLGNDYIACGAKLDLFQSIPYKLGFRCPDRTTCSSSLAILCQTNG
jgi:hypothetical protein